MVKGMPQGQICIQKIYPNHNYYTQLFNLHQIATKIVISVRPFNVII